MKYFLCSIECELSLSDIEFIIKDANIPTADITFEETVGDFKRKKYIVIHSVDRIKIFNFRVAFMKSKLNGIWFLNKMPPKQRPLNTNHTFSDKLKHKPNKNFSLNSSNMYH